MKHTSVLALKVTILSVATQKKAKWPLALALIWCIFICLFPFPGQDIGSFNIPLFVVMVIPTGLAAGYLFAVALQFLFVNIFAYTESEEARRLPILHRVGRNFVVWLMLVCGFGLLGGYIELSPLWALSKRGVQAPGYQLLNAKGERYGYEFRVGSKTYGIPLSQRSGEKLRRGKPLQITYDPSDPIQSIEGNPKLALEEKLFDVAMIGFFFPTAIMCFFKPMILRWKEPTYLKQHSLY